MGTCRAGERGCEHGQVAASTGALDTTMSHPLHPALSSPHCPVPQALPLPLTPAHLVQSGDEDTSGVTLPHLEPGVTACAASS